MTSTPEIALRPARRRLAPLALAACLTVLAAGVRHRAGQRPGPGGQPAADGVVQGQDYPQLIPVPPGKGWTPVQIVSGFLAANASFANNHAVAREYLTPGQARAWNPGWAVTVVAQPKLEKAVLASQAG